MWCEMGYLLKTLVLVILVSVNIIPGVHLGSSYSYDNFVRHRPRSRPEPGGYGPSPIRSKQNHVEHGPYHKTATKSNYGPPLHYSPKPHYGKHRSPPPSKPYYGTPPTPRYRDYDYGTPPPSHYKHYNNYKDFTAKLPPKPSYPKYGSSSDFDYESYAPKSSKSNYGRYNSDDIGRSTPYILGKPSKNGYESSSSYYGHGPKPKHNEDRYESSKYYGNGAKSKTSKKRYGSSSYYKYDPKAKPSKDDYGSSAYYGESPRKSYIDDGLPQYGKMSHNEHPPKYTKSKRRTSILNGYGSDHEPTPPGGDYEPYDEDYDQFSHYHGGYDQPEGRKGSFTKRSKDRLKYRKSNRHKKYVSKHEEGYPGPSKYDHGPPPPWYVTKHKGAPPTSYKGPKSRHDDYRDSHPPYKTKFVSPYDHTRSYNKGKTGQAIFLAKNIHNYNILNFS